MSDELARAAASIELTDEQRERFLALLEQDPGRGHVATLRELGVEGTRGQIRRAVAEQLADDIAALRGDTIRRELLRRSLVGVEEDVWHDGAIVGQRRVFSDRLLDLAARLYLPEARQQVEVVGAGGGPVRVEVDGGRVTGISEVIQLAQAVGAGLREGLGAGTPRTALPGAGPVLPDPSDDQPAAGLVAPAG